MNEELDAMQPIVTQPEQEIQPNYNQPQPTQPTTEPNPAPKQEATEPPTQEEKKMSIDNLSRYSLEELEAEMEELEAEMERKKKLRSNFVLDENDQCNLARFLWSHEMLTSYQCVQEVAFCVPGFTLLKAIAKYPGKLTKFAFLKDEDGNPTTDKEGFYAIHIVSADGECVVDYTFDKYSENFSIIKEKL